MRLVVLTAALLLVVAALAGAQVLPVFNTSRLYPTEAEFNRAIQPYQQAITANARNARAQYWLGYAYLYAYRQWSVGAAPYASGYLTRVIPPLEEAIKIDMGFLAAYLALHDAYVLMGDQQKADEVVQKMFANTRPKWLAPLSSTP